MKDINAAGGPSFLEAVLTSEDNNPIIVLLGNESHTLGRTYSVNSLIEVAIQP